MVESRTTWDISKLISAAIEKALTEIHTCLPARVESFDASTGLAKVVPLLKRKYVTEDTAVQLPVISGVPVVFPRTAGAWLRLPVSAGDYVLLVFSERSIDKWLESGGAVDPEDPSKFALNDAIAIPGLYPKIDPVDVIGAQTSLEIVNGPAVVEITAAGAVKISGATSVEMNTGGIVPPTGVVTGMCVCAYTGTPHPDVSLTVKASK